MLRLLTTVGPNGVPQWVLRGTLLGRERTVAVLVLLQLVIQYSLFVLLKIFYYDFDWQLMLFSYGVTFTLQAAYWFVRRQARFPILGTLIMCNSYLLFFQGAWQNMLWVICLAWASRTFLLRDDGRNLLNAGTFGIFWGGVLSTYVLSGRLNSVSHGLTTVPHLQLALVLVGAGMAWLGGYLSIPLAILISFMFFRGGPTAAELVVLVIAAPDPVTTPGKTWPRWVFGLLTGSLSAMYWRLFPLGSDLLKVTGVVTAGLLMPFLRDRDWKGLMERLIGRYGEERFWDRTGLRLMAVAILAVLGLAIEQSRPTHRHELSVMVSDSRTHELLTQAPAIPSWPSHAFTMSFPQKECTVRWEELFRGWDTRCESDWEEAPDVAQMKLRLELACRQGAPVDATPFIHVDQYRQWSRQRPGLPEHQQSELFFSLDQDALARACP